MKIRNLKKIAVSTMALAMGAALAGSISGTVAWYQYSTRSTVSYSGASAHCTENLQIRLGAIAAEAGPAVANGAVFENGVKYYTRATDASGAGELNDGTYAYTLSTTGDGDATADAADKYYPLVCLGADATDWVSDLRLAAVQSYLAMVRGKADYNLRPVTSGALALNAAASTFYKSPIYQYESKTVWGTASALDFAELNLEFRVVDVNGSRTAGDYDTFLAKKVYLSDLEMNNLVVASKEDITDALRVSFDGTNDITYSTHGDDVNVFGKLDLNNDGVFDVQEAYEYNMLGIVADTAARDAITVKATGDMVGVSADQKVYEWDGSAWVETTHYCLYGDDAQVAKSTELDPANLADDSDPYAISGTELFTTAADGTPVGLTVRIYLEGWQELGGTPSALWSDEDYVGSAFRVNMRFSCDAHVEHN